MVGLSGDFLKKLPLEYQIVTKTYLKPTYLPAPAPGRSAVTPEKVLDRKRGREGLSPTGITPPPKMTTELDQAAINLVSSPTIAPTRPGQAKGLLAAVTLPTYGNMTVENANTRSMNKSSGGN